MTISEFAQWAVLIISESSNVGIAKHLLSLELSEPRENDFPTFCE